jgi:hypothetical protein
VAFAKHYEKQGENPKSQTRKMKKGKEGRKEVRRKDDEERIKEIAKRYGGTRVERQQKVCVTHACTAEASSGKRFD